MGVAWVDTIEDHNELLNQYLIKSPMFFLVCSHLGY